MKITHLFTNKNGLSSFADIDLPLEREGVEQFIGLRAGTMMTLNETDAGHSYDWHNAPKKQWVVTLQGIIEVRLRDGTSRQLGAGSILLAEDLTGSGHATTVISKEPWRCVYLPFDGEMRV